jgi:hypothetical protein
MSNTLEEWRPIVGLEDLYEVSSLGRVRSVERLITQRHRNGKWMSYKLPSKVLTPCGSPYTHVHLGKHRRCVKVHILVAKAFLTVCPGKYGKEKDCWNIDHINGDTKDNRACNLQWLRRRDNSYVKSGLQHDAKGRFISLKGSNTHKPAGIWTVNKPTR